MFSGRQVQFAFSSQEKVYSVTSWLRLVLLNTKSTLRHFLLFVFSRKSEQKVKITLQIKVAACLRCNLLFVTKYMKLN